MGLELLIFFGRRRRADDGRPPLITLMTMESLGKCLLPFGGALFHRSDAARRSSIPTSRLATGSDSNDDLEHLFARIMKSLDEGVVPEPERTEDEFQVLLGRNTRTRWL